MQSSTVLVIWFSVSSFGFKVVSVTIGSQKGISTASYDKRLTIKSLGGPLY